MPDKETGNLPAFRAHSDIYLEKVSGLGFKTEYYAIVMLNVAVDDHILSRTHNGTGQIKIPLTKELYEKYEHALEIKPSTSSERPTKLLSLEGKLEVKVESICIN